MTVKHRLQAYLKAMLQVSIARRMLLTWLDRSP